MTKNNWTTLFLLTIGILLIQFSVHLLFGIDCWNNYTIIVYSVVFGITYAGIPLLVKLKSKDQQLFVQGFLAFTVIQMLLLMTLILIVIVKYREIAINFSFQLLALFFASLGIQTVILLRAKK